MSNSDIKYVKQWLVSLFRASRCCALRTNGAEFVIRHPDRCGVVKEASVTKISYRE
jgi:hypothetical protein